MGKLIVTWITIISAAGNVFVIVPIINLFVLVVWPLILLTQIPPYLLIAIYKFFHISSPGWIVFIIFNIIPSIIILIVAFQLRAKKDWARMALICLFELFIVLNIIDFFFYLLQQNKFPDSHAHGLPLPIQFLYGYGIVMSFYIISIIILARNKN